MAQAVQRGVPPREDGGGCVVLAGPPLSLDAFFQLTEGGGSFLLHDQVVHTGRQVVPGELDGDLDVPPLLLLLPRLGLEPVPAGTERLGSDERLNRVQKLTV